jgi:ribosome-associated heat shock protein Hsp15
MDDRMRLDKWLWHARFFRTRALAQAACAAGKVRINMVRTHKSHQQVGAGDVLTFAQGGRIRVVRVLALAERRGSASGAGQLYEEVPANAFAAEADTMPPAALRGLE